MTRVRAPPTSRHVFVGRESELLALADALDDARAVRGRLVLLSGEPGIGKSRLVDEFASRVRESGERLLWGQSWEGGGAPPYWPWVQLLRSYLRTEDPDTARTHIASGAADIAQMLPEIRDLFPDLHPPPTVDPESARFQLFDSTASFLLNASRRQPLVLVLEDLHAADTPSLLLLQFLTDQIVDARLLILATYRDVELTPEHPLTTAVGELARQPSVDRIHLGGLVEDDVARFVAAVTGASPPPPLVSALHRETAGNPLFIGEAVRLLAAEGRLKHLSDAATLRVVVPKGVRDVIGRRLDHLDDETRHALSLASVLGPEFSTEALRRLAGVKPDELLGVVDRASEAGLIAPLGGAIGRFRFSHELVRETLYDELTSAIRMRLHRQAAEVLRQLYAPDEVEHLAELAHHFFEAASLGGASIAADFARRAGEEAARSLAYEEAARLYRMAVQALELTDPVDFELLGEVLLAEGEALARAGDLPAAREILLRAATNAKRTGAATQLARTALEYGGRMIWARAGKDPHLIPMLQDALVLLGGSDDGLRARLLTRLACALRSSPDRTSSATLSQQAVDLARQLDDPSTLGYALVGRAWAIYGPENPEERLPLAEEIIDVSEAAGDAERIFDGYAARFVTLNDLGRVTQGAAELSLMQRRAEELRQPAQWWVVRSWGTLLALLFGDFDRAEELMRLELRAGQPVTAAHDDASAHAMHLFLLRREQGRVGEAEELVRVAIDEFPWYPVHRTALTCLLLDLGREAEARAVFEELAVERFAALYRDCEWLLGMALASEACTMLGDRDRAMALYEELLPFQGRHAVAIAEGSVGAMARCLGLLATTMDRFDDAIHHFEDAIRMNEGMGAKPWTAHSRYDLAASLLQRDRPGDRERAVEELSSVRSICEDLGMLALGEKVAKRLGELGSWSAGQPAATPPTSPGVFRREGEYWTVVFDREAFRLKDTKGLRYLARLLAEPGREFHVLDLVADGSAPSVRGVGADEIRSGADPFGDAGAILDPQAKASYKRRLDDLEDEIAEAESIGDSDRAERARSEREFIARELAAAVGLGGRDRLAASAAERARINVTRAVKAALDRIGAHSSHLGEHLAATVRTGLFCSYVPDPRTPISWQT